MKRSAAILVALTVVLSGIHVAIGGTPPEVTTRFFQGIPGVEIDLCIDGVEVASSVAFETTVHGPSYPADPDPPFVAHSYEIREAAVGSCTGTLLDEDFFGVVNRDKNILLAYQAGNGSPRTWAYPMAWRPRVREGRTEFSIGPFAAAPKVHVGMDGHRLLTLTADDSTYIFSQYHAGSHRFTVRDKATREVLATETIYMPEGVTWFLMFYGDATGGYGIRAFSRIVGVRSSPSR